MLEIPNLLEWIPPHWYKFLTALTIPEVLCLVEISDSKYQNSLKVKLLPGPVIDFQYC